MRFSQRLKIKPIKTELQIESMDEDLRIRLWNTVYFFYLEKFGTSKHYEKGQMFIRILYVDFLNEPLDTVDEFYDFQLIRLKKRFFEWDWFEVYEFIEFVANFENDETFMRLCNNVLEKELSGYRFIGTKLIPITSDVELREIGQAIEISQKMKLSGANAHLKAALSKLSDRTTPDYRNSIKESISAVEAVVQIISGNPKAELGQALKLIEEKVSLHPALKKGFLSIYGYTSDADGIRHAMIDDSQCDFDDAKYMLVSCSAFVNYLIMKATKANII